MSRISIDRPAAVLAALSAVAALAGCATNKDALLEHDGQTMLEIWRQETGGPGGGSRASRELLDARQALRRPLTERGPRTEREPRTESDVISTPRVEASYTRTAQNEIERQFHRLPNPDLRDVRLSSPGRHRSRARARLQHGVPALSARAVRLAGRAAGGLLNGRVAVVALVAQGRASRRGVRGVAHRCLAAPCRGAQTPRYPGTRRDSATPKRNVATLADEQALYDVAPSFVDLLPWVEYLPDSQSLLARGRRVGGGLLRADADRHRGTRDRLALAGPRCARKRAAGQLRRARRASLGRSALRPRRGRLGGLPARFARLRPTARSRHRVQRFLSAVSRASS